MPSAVNVKVPTACSPPFDSAGQLEWTGTKCFCFLKLGWALETNLQEVDMIK